MNAQNQTNDMTGKAYLSVSGLQSYYGESYIVQDIGFSERG